MKKSATIKILGIDELRKAMTAEAAKLHTDLAREVTKAAIAIRADVIKAIQRGPKTGRVYRRGNVEHRASAPGEAPATDRGALVSSVYYIQNTSTSATVGSRLAYAYHLEFGTRHTKPRPAWVPAVERARAKFGKGVRLSVQRMAAR